MYMRQGKTTKERENEREREREKERERATTAGGANRASGFNIIPRNTISGPCPTPVRVPMARHKKPAKPGKQEQKEKGKRSRTRMRGRRCCKWVAEVEATQ